MTLKGQSLLLLLSAITNIMIPKFVTSVALTFLLVLAASTPSLGDGVPPGGVAPGEDIPLGEGDCYISPDYYALNDINLETDLALSDLPTATAVAGGYMEVTAGDDWQITCIETGDDPDGKMSLETSILYTPLQINSGSTQTLLSDSPEVIETGSATLCQNEVITPIQVSPKYEQFIDPVNDLSKAAGTYSIQIQYTLQLS